MLVIENKVPTMETIQKIFYKINPTFEFGLLCHIYDVVKDINAITNWEQESITFEDLAGIEYTYNEILNEATQRENDFLVIK
tara:strand:+ start:2007 stop:2252 length:246 start_codon:yes stop_codon:yes gene_type:complete